MALTEEQRRQLQSRMGQPPANLQRPSLPGAIPPDIQALVSGLPPAQATIKYGPSGRRMSLPHRTFRWRENWGLNTPKAK